MLWQIVIGLVAMTNGSRIAAQTPAVAAHVQADAAVDELLARRVTVHLKNVSLAKAIDSVSRIAKVFIEFQLLLLKEHSESITVDMIDKPLGVVLEQILSGTKLRIVSGGLESLTIIASPERQADSVPDIGTISGRVVDSVTGRGLAGAKIRVAGTKIATTTADNGSFTVDDVPVGDRLLTVKLFGYRPNERAMTIAAAERVTLRIWLVAAPNVLSDVITTATGVQRKLEVGNDITTLNVDSIQRVAPITSVTDLLETRVTGLTVLHSSGTPGDPSRLRLRGPGSIYESNDPIVIVDGIRVYGEQSNSRNTNQAGTAAGNVSNSGNFGSGQAYARPSPLDQIDPNDIEKVEVLKGPSASALYGSDAASGVIIITTKRGRAGPTHWDAQLGVGVNWIPGTWPNTYYRFGHTVTNPSGTICNWYDPGCMIDSIVAFQALNDSRYTVLSHGNDHMASLTVSGGNGPLTYNLTGSATGDVGNLKLPEIQKTVYQTDYGAIPRWMARPDNYQTWGGGGSLNARPTAQATVTLVSSLFTSTQQRSSLETALTQLDGEYIDSAVIASRPLVSGYVERITSRQLNSTNSLVAAWTPRSWLPLTMTGGINSIQTTDNAYVPYGINTIGDRRGSSEDTSGVYGIGHGNSQNQTLSVGTMVPFFRQQVTLALGGNIVSQTTTDFSVATNLLAPGVSVPTSFQRVDGLGSVQNSLATQSTSATSTYGWYVEPRVNVLSRFFVSPGFRLDGGSGGSTSSGSVGGLSAFPKIDLSYLAVDRQNDRPLLGVLTQLRPRLAFGFAGTQPTPNLKLRLLNDQGTSAVVPLNDSTTLPIVALGELGNTKLRPERSSELEGGMDATLWQGRVLVTYTQYNKTRHDALLQTVAAPSVAASPTSNAYSINNSYWVNIGEIRNTGTEITLQATVLRSRALSWNIGVNLASDHNQVVHLNAGEAPLAGAGNGPSRLPQYRIIPGYPLFGIWVQPIVSFADANHNGVIEPNEIRYGDSAVYVGQPNPNYQLTMNTDLAFLNGRLSLHGVFSYQNGLTQFNDGACNSGAFLNLPNAPNTPLATEAAVVAAGCTGSPNGGQTVIGLIQTVNFFRFQSLSINYEVPPRVATWFQVPRMTLALQGSNLGLHTNYRGKDPDVNAFSTVPGNEEITQDEGEIPQPRTWWIKVTLSK